MQRLLGFGQQPRRPPFPSGFFSSRAPQASPSRNARSQFQNFSGSSKSRPPSSKNSGGPRGTAGTAKGKASSATTNTKTAAASEVAGTGKEQAGPSLAASAKSIDRDTTTNQTILKRADGNRIKPVNDVAPRFPRSIVPAPILGTAPQQIQLDMFYALDRPLLEVTIPSGSRESASNSDRKFMEIVGELEESEEGALSMLESGEYDPYLVLEPDGADPEWAEGTDKFLASLDHTIPPPFPHSTKEGINESALSPNVHSKQSKRQRSIELRQKDIDYLFPIQAAARAQEEEEHSRSAHLPPTSSRRSSFSSAQNFPIYSGSTRTFSGIPTHSLANRFLTSHLDKHLWKALCEWEGFRKALSAAARRLMKGKGRSDTQQPKSEEGVSKSIQRLRSFARIRAKRPKRGKTWNEQITELQKFFSNAIREGNVVIISLQSPNDLKPSLKSLGLGQLVGKAPAGDAALPQAHSEEVKMAAKQLGKDFAGFLGQVVEIGATPLNAGSQWKSQTMLEADFRAAWKAISSETGNSIGQYSENEQDQNNHQFDLTHIEALEEDPSTDHSPSPAHSTARRNLGTLSRASRVQSTRGQYLRRTLKERLESRGVHLVGQYRTISMDSVKRKRRKRISRHKQVQLS